MKKMTCAVPLVAIAMLCGCGAGDDGRGALGTSAEAIGESSCFQDGDKEDVLACLTVDECGPDHLEPLDWTSPRTYSHPSCYKAAEAVIIDYSDVYSGPGDVPGGIYVDWADAVPTTASACASAFMRADLYVVGADLIGSKTSHGQWVDAGSFAFCEPPGVSFTSEIPLYPGYTGVYGVSATARTSSSSSAPTRALHMEQRAPVIVR